jgi:endo-1,3(4)-beta-glucanase
MLHVKFFDIVAHAAIDFLGRRLKILVVCVCVEKIHPASFLSIILLSLSLSLSSLMCDHIRHHPRFFQRTACNHNTSPLRLRLSGLLSTLAIHAKRERKNDRRRRHNSRCLSDPFLVFTAHCTKMPPKPESEANTASGIASKDYGSIDRDVEQAPLLSNMSFSQESLESQRYCGPKERRRILKIVGIVIAVVAVISMILYKVLPDVAPDSASQMESPPHHSDVSTSTNLFTLDPVRDLNMLSVDRSKTDASPSPIWNGRGEKEPLPTNSWYMVSCCASNECEKDLPKVVSHFFSPSLQNLVSHKASFMPDESTSAYTIPYIVDTAAHEAIPNMAGVRIHWPVLQASSNNIQMVDDFKNSLSVGTVGLAKENDDKSRPMSKAVPYRVVGSGKLSPLGVALEWGGDNAGSNSTATKRMTTQIVRGMAYVTLQYQNLLPTFYSYNGLASRIKVDDDGSDTTKPTTTLSCDGNSTEPTLVEKHLHIHFINSDFTWMVFFSQPVLVTCSMGDGDDWSRDFQLHVVEMFRIGEGSSDIGDGGDIIDPLTVRVALLNQCTTGKATLQAHCKEMAQWNDPAGYEELLKTHVQALPSTLPRIDFQYNNDTTDMTIDWGASSHSQDNDTPLLMYALPHHQEMISNQNDTTTLAKITDHCIGTFHGSTCLVRGNTWTLREDLGKPLSFWAPRPPHADMIPNLAKALSKDIQYRLSANLMRGAADTYFSGKVLARYARVIVIADELKQLAKGNADDLICKYDDVSRDELQASVKAASVASLPSDKQLQNAIDSLKHGVRAWLDSDAEAPFVFDKTWGGMVNCGCRYVGKGEHGYCNNTFPDCPALIDVNEDFGNGYYNDHHYHYGYHLYAAAVAAKFDPEWAMEYMADIMLYIRDFANPMDDDPHFTQYRQKDWFLGSSWASGIVSGENSPHGRNEESSSEAISAYEAMALFGSAMIDAFSDDKSMLPTAKLLQRSGQLLTATELHATNRYWHVWSSDTHNSSFPEAYTQPVVGMLYDTMASFQTWFAPWAVVSYGIQLLPLTPVAERRDNPEWASILYPKYKEACADAGDFCVENGWSILQAGLLATAGDTKGALQEAMAIPDFVFETQGGMGNSLTNTIWYVATRKPFESSLVSKGS